MNILNDASNVLANVNVKKPLFTKEFVNKVQEIDIKQMGTGSREPAIKTKEDVEKFKEVLDVTNEIFFGDDSHFEFSIHEKTGTIMSKLVDTRTGDIIREIPSEKILDMISGIWEVAGLIVDEQA